jgi:hypothetical protein
MPNIQKTQDQFQEAFAAFEKEHPEVVEAMKVMSVSFQDYLQSLAALKEAPSTSGNASTVSST